MAVFPDGKGLWLRFTSKLDPDHVAERCERAGVEWVAAMVLRQTPPNAAVPLAQGVIDALLERGIRVIPWAMTVPGGAEEAAQHLIREARRADEQWVIVDAEEAYAGTGATDSKRLVDRIHDAGLRAGVTSYHRPWATWPRWCGFIDADAGLPQMAYPETPNGEDRLAPLAAAWGKHFSFVSPVAEPALALRKGIVPAHLFRALPRPDGSLSVWDWNWFETLPVRWQALKAVEIPGRS